MSKTAEDITEYLKKVSTLESSIYTQERVLLKAIAVIKMAKVEKENIPEPIDKSNNLEKPHEPVLEMRTVSKEVKIRSIVLLISAVMFILCMFTGIGKSLGGSFIGACSLMAGLFSCSGLKSAIKERRDSINQNKINIRNYELNKKNYEQEIKKYENDKKVARETYQAAIEKYQIQLEKAELKYEFEYKKAFLNYLKAQADIKLLSSSLLESKKLLMRLYSSDIIFPKYQNLVATTTMYEYFASGRVSELTGPDGAYNLYEQELRSNIIINKLDTISSQLEKIKNNQYVLYEAIKDTNKYLSEITGELKSINEGILSIDSGINDIAHSSKITSYYSEITAKNTEALMYIELVTQ